MTALPEDVLEGLRASLRRPRFEIIPMKGVEEEIPHLPAGATVTVTASPTKGIEATLELVAQLRRQGHHVVPHLAARLMPSPAHVREVIDRVDQLGITEVFVIAGDAAVPAGPFEGAADLLEAMAGLGHPFTEVGITGYPESHAFLSDTVTIDSMARKAPHATYIVSQICYDPAVIAWWVGAVRARGVALPIYLGLPGAVDRARLLSISLRIGLGDSLRFLRKQSGLASRLLTGYTPDELLAALAPVVAQDGNGVVGWHLFTFNAVASTEQWRQRLLAGAKP